MMKTVKAIINTRVSTAEQLSNNSLNRQIESVEKAAIKLGAIVPEDGRWSGSVSSKAGTNVTRKDLQEMLDYCARHKDVKYAIFDEYDRYMRSVSEGPYFEVKFSLLGVKVWYASESDTFNGDDAMAKLMRSLSAFKAEGSNEERQKKSIAGHEKALREGRYTFPPKPGYMKGVTPGVHRIDPHTFPYLQAALKEMLSGSYTPLEAMKRLNESHFALNHAVWKMDKFRSFAIDPYNAGILQIDKQVKERNEHGLHQPMISLQEHQQLLRMLDGRSKPRGPKKQYNPEFPMNKLLTCDDCGSDAKFTGSRKNNGYARKVTRYYYKYHCRGCGKAYHRADVHQAITEKLAEITYTNGQRKELIEALRTVWEVKRRDKIKAIEASQKRCQQLEDTKSKLIIELARSDDAFREDVRREIDSVKQRIIEAETTLNDLDDLEKDLIEFVRFSLEYTNNLAIDWWELDHEERVQCQQLLFPGGISFDAQKKVGLKALSPIYTLQPNKKALRLDRKALMVELAGTAPASVGLSWLIVYRHSSFCCLRA